MRKTMVYKILLRLLVILLTNNLLEAMVIKNISLIVGDQCNKKINRCLCLFAFLKIHMYIGEIIRLSFGIFFYSLRVEFLVNTWKMKCLRISASKPSTTLPLFCENEPMSWLIAALTQQSNKVQHGRSTIFQLEDQKIQLP
jgi:hypothetical protein